MQIHVCWCQWSDLLHYPTRLLLSRLKWLKELCLIHGTLHTTGMVPPAKGTQTLWVSWTQASRFMPYPLRHRVRMNYKLCCVSVYYLKTIFPKHGNNKSKDRKLLKGSWYIFPKIPLKRLYEFTHQWTWYTNNHLVTSLPPLGITILEYSVKLTRESRKKCQSPYPSMIESKHAHSNFQPQQCQG